MWFGTVVPDHWEANRGTWLQDRLAPGLPATYHLRLDDSFATVNAGGHTSLVALGLAVSRSTKSSGSGKLFDSSEALFCFVAAIGAIFVALSLFLTACFSRKLGSMHIWATAFFSEDNHFQAALLGGACMTMWLAVPIMMEQSQWARGLLRTPALHLAHVALMLGFIALHFGCADDTVWVSFGCLSRGTVRWSYAACLGLVGLAALALSRAQHDVREHDARELAAEEPSPQGKRSRGQRFEDDFDTDFEISMKVAYVAVAIVSIAGATAATASAVTTLPATAHRWALLACVAFAFAAIYSPRFKTWQRAIEQDDPSCQRMAREQEAWEAAQPAGHSAYAAAALALAAEGLRGTAAALATTAAAAAVAAATLDGPTRRWALLVCALAAFGLYSRWFKARQRSTEEEDPACRRMAREQEAWEAAQLQPPAKA